MTKRTKTTKEFDGICSICRGPIPVEHGSWKYGHNAEPVNDGRCCSDCNHNVVIPTRLWHLHAGVATRK
jgi:hypothetical protein